MTFEATILKAPRGQRLTKVYTDPNTPPRDYDNVLLVTAREVTFDTFQEFVECLLNLAPHECLIRGRVRDAARADVLAGHEVRRLEYDRDESLAAFEAAPRNWIVLDVDKTDVPFDPNNVEGSIDAWRATLPAEIREAQSAFFLSASSHRSPTVRGKLVVALDLPISNEAAAEYAKRNGYDPSVCRTVQPNYFAAPVFEGCTDPLAEFRGAMLFEGQPARLPAIAVESPTPDQHLGERPPLPADLPPLSERASQLAELIFDRWLEGDRVEGHAWLHLAGWLLGQGWSKGELASMLAVLDAAEPDASKRAEHVHILANARPLDGPGGAREWLGDAFERVDRIANHNPVAEAYAKRVAAAEAFTPVTGDTVEQTDAIGRIVDWSGPITPIRYLCQGLGLGWVGKCAGLHGYAGTSKGMLLARIALSAASGLPFLGHEFTRVPVVYCDAETGALAENRIKRLALAMGIDLAALAREGWFTFRHVDIKLDDLYCAIEQRAHDADRGSGTVIALDSYSSLVSGDENSAEYADPMWRLGQLGQRSNALPICTLHDRKAKDERGRANPLGEISGTNRIAAALASSIRLTPNESNDRIITVGCTRAPEKRFEPIELEWRDTPDGGIEARSKTIHIPTQEEAATTARDAHAQENESRVRSAILRDLATAGGGRYANALRSRLSVGSKVLGRVLDSMCARGEVVRSEAGPNDRGIYTMTDTGRTAHAQLAHVAESARKWQSTRNNRKQ